MRLSYRPCSYHSIVTSPSASGSPSALVKSYETETSPLGHLGSSSPLLSVTRHPTSMSSPMPPDAEPLSHWARTSRARPMRPYTVSVVPSSLGTSLVTLTTISFSAPDGLACTFLSQTPAVQSSAPKVRSSPFSSSRSEWFGVISTESAISKLLYRHSLCHSIHMERGRHGQVNLVRRHHRDLRRAGASGIADGQTQPVTLKPAGYSQSSALDSA